MKRIYLSPPHLTDDAISFLQDAVASNWIAPVGPHVDAFESELLSLMGTGNLIVVNSGTSAIHLGLLGLGVDAGDEVICSTFTFCASANPIVYCGAVPVFVDSERDTWNMDPVLLEEAIADRLKTGRKPKAIIVVHLYGMPARMEEILSISHKYDIPVLEDAAEALGSLYDGRQVGTLGKCGVFSFNGNKIITASGGGALFSEDEAFVSNGRYLRHEAKEPLPHYEHKAIGYNYRLSNLLAAVGRSQLKVLPGRVAARRKNFDFYTKALQSIPGIEFQREARRMHSNRWLTTIVVRHPDRSVESIRLRLEEDHIESRPAWKPLHLQPVFAGAPAYLNGVSEDLFRHGLCLPSGTALSDNDLARVSEIILELFES